MFPEASSVTETHFQFYSHLTVHVTVFQVSDIYPLQAIQTAMSREPPGWEVPWISTERLSLDDSLKA